MPKILYIGGFEMPDKNAAAQRVLSIAKVLKALGYSISFYGITKSKDFHGVVNGFNYEAKDYPANFLQWVRYAVGFGIIGYVRKHKPEYVITYNYPAIAQFRLVCYCRLNNIKIVGDITEWYESKEVIKHIDTSLRMRWCNKLLDGIICISSYLSKYYSRQRCLQLPPLVDLEEPKWKKIEINNKDSNIHLVYVGSPGKKDRLDYIINGIFQTKISNLHLDVIGITENEYKKTYPEFQNVKETDFVSFYGRMPHNDAVQKLSQSDFQIFFRDNSRVNNAGFPTKLVESLSAGVPVITNKISNISDYLIDGYNGFMIDTPSEENIREILLKISTLSPQNICELKNHISIHVFDYHNYINDISLFFQSI